MNDVAFTSCKIGDLEIKNRFVMSAAVDGLAGNLDARIQRFSAFVNGGIGLVIAGCVLCQRKEGYFVVINDFGQSYPCSV